MKSAISLSSLGALLCVGCASDRALSGNSALPKEVGMTKEQIIALYGQTNNQRVSANGETWIYNLNAGEFIPWNVGYRPKVRIIDFGKDARVTSLTYSQ